MRMRAVAVVGIVGIVENAHGHGHGHGHGAGCL